MRMERPEGGLRIILSAPAKMGKTEVALRVADWFGIPIVEISELVTTTWCERVGLIADYDQRVLEYCATHNEPVSWRAVREVYRPEISVFSKAEMSKDRYRWIRPVIDKNPFCVVPSGRVWADYEYPQRYGAFFIRVHMDEWQHRRAVKSEEAYQKILASSLETDCLNIPWSQGYTLNAREVPGYFLHNPFHPDASPEHNGQALKREVDRICADISQHLVLPWEQPEVSIPPRRPAELHCALA